MSTPESLWRVMAAASVQAVFETANADQPVVNCRIAAEIRALRDRVVPETPEPPLGETGSRDELQDWANWNARNNIWWELTEEAEKAEKGE